MIDTTDNMTATTKPTSDDIERAQCGVANVERIYSFIASFSILGLIGLGVILCLTASVVHAQQFSSNDFAPAATQGNGWWSPEREASTVVVPHLQVGMSKLAGFAISEPVRNSTIEQSDYLPSEETDRPIVNPRNFEFELERQSSEVSPSIEGDLLSTRSFLSILEAKYGMWESSLADTRSLMNVNGISVFPLVQIDYAQWRLPIGLYAPPLRGSDSR